jgi:hypothetical protein
VPIPIACSLTPEGASHRVEEWRRFLLASVSAAERPTESQLRLLLSPSPGDLLAAVALAQSEKACCPFFEFSIDVETDACWLLLAVPPDASGILDGFAGLLPSEVRP